jgi:CheY-like chemotaxis protein
MMAVDMFEDAGFSVLEASSGEKALELMKQCGELTALFTDVDLAKTIDGFYLARMVHDAHPQAPIIVVSGQCIATDGDLPEGARFIGKPYDPDVVTATLNEMISAAGQNQG